eukprot:CAMPEP_0178747280 /NCGR_PEP_ID=MMETSP0744-20121128/8237_1 /TAXON_ID=913974 /ORGANISM="Nitzschia punctata, Strain CCMP561" /LENGTH=291 /DNA_ID=CAMNT_0020400505 /DNA_START=246 /DNA_END=1121 /DNA_ORIENTATION=-
MVSVLKIVSFNTYLISKRYNNNHETFSGVRALKIREVLEGNDLCFFQEVWGAGLPELLRDVTAHVTPPLRTPWLVFGNGLLAETINTAYLHIMKTGGLYDFSTPSMICRYRKKHTFTKSRSKSRKGVEATLWDVPQWGEGKKLLVFNTHLDPWSVSNRRHQVGEILEFFRDTLQTIDERSNGTHDWSNTGVIALGDFNIKADSAEYEETLMSNQGWIDYFQDELGQTYATDNSLANYPEDCGRIDYIFGVERYGTSHRFLPLKAVSRSIRKEPVGEESSDHYALLLDLLPA